MTQQGELLKSYTDQAFQVLDTGIQKVLRENSTYLEISCEPTLTMRWLMPRLANFYESSGIDIRLSTAGGPVTLGASGLSMAIRRDDFEIPALYKSTVLVNEWVGPVFSPDYQLYLAINDIDHTKTKAMSPQTNGICERFHKTILNEFYQVTFRKKLYQTLEELQKDLDEWLSYYNNERTHQGKMCNGRTPVDTLTDGKRVWAEKNLTRI